LDALFYQDDRNLEDTALTDVDILAKHIFLKDCEVIELEDARAMAIEIVAALIWKGYFAPSGQEEG
jgi:hypothetical protein